MTIQEIRVSYINEKDLRGEDLAHEAKRTLGIETGEVETSKVYRIEGVIKEDVRRLGKELFVDPVNQTFSLNQPLIEGEKQTIEVAYRPGVMNPEAASIMKAAKDLGISPLAVNTSWEYGFPQDLSGKEIERITRRLLVNPTVQQIVRQRPETLIIFGEPGSVKTIPIRELSNDGLMDLSRDQLFLNLEEMQVIQDYFKGIGRDPTDVEVETLAQTWSEHCVHKTFKAKIIAEGKEKPPLIERIRNTSFKYAQVVLSSFRDNAGVIAFYEETAIAGKGETHNSPVAIEPYGGAMTRSGGVFRDIAGVGQGGENLFSLDINCFGPPDLPPEAVLPGCHHPDYLLRFNFFGIRDYGNRMGIPTVNADFCFHPDFRGKCTSLGVTFGITPEDKCQKGEPKPGDLIISVGGRTGRDGIHGVTFASGEMTERTISVNATAVQIGNAIEEKRMFDALIVCRDEGLVRAITDCGGGGYSSAIGEIGQDVGVTVDLEKAPLKYPGLSPWEIWLSEAQERMIVVSDPKNLERLEEIFAKFNVEMNILGKFTGDKRLTLRYEGKVVADLEMEFLHHGLPQRIMEAHWQPPEKDERKPGLPSDWSETFQKVLSHWNVCSKEPIVRQYDHGVQGANALSPFVGVYQDIPSDAIVVTPIRGKPYGLVAAHGFNPILNKIDPYWGSLWAATEAISNYIAVGGNYKEAALIDNFIWPFPDKESLGDLDRSVDGLCDFMDLLQIPCVSGKDSLSSTYRGKDGTVIKIPPVLNISIFGRIPDVEKTTSSDFKKSDSTICLVGNLDKENLAGSVYYNTCGLMGTNLPKVDLKNLPSVLERIYEGIQSGRILACHDISRGGVATALAEMCFGGDCGAKIDLATLGTVRPDFLLFNETAGCFLVEVENQEVAGELFAGVPWRVFGETQPEKEIKVENLFTAAIDSLKNAWQAPMEGVIG